jgi:hypothetical protein
LALEKPCTACELSIPSMNTLHITVQESVDYIKSYDYERLEPSEVLLLDSDFEQSPKLDSQNVKVNNKNQLESLQRKTADKITALSYLQPKHLENFKKFVIASQPKLLFVNFAWLGLAGTIDLISTLSSVQSLKEVYFGFAFGGPDPLEQGTYQPPKWELNTDGSARLWQSIKEFLTKNHSVEILKLGFCFHSQSDKDNMEEGIKSAKSLKKIGYLDFYQNSPEPEEINRILQ